MIDDYDDDADDNENFRGQTVTGLCIGMKSSCLQGVHLASLRHLNQLA